MASFSVGGALAGAAVAVKNFATSTRDINIFSRQVGLGVESLRELRALGEHFGMSWDQTQASLKQFATNLDDIRHRWEKVYGALRGHNMADLAEDLKKLADAGDVKGAVDHALQALKAIQNPQRRREIAELLFGSDQWAVVASEMTPRLRKAIRDAMGELPKGSAEAAEAFALNWTQMTLGVERFRDEALGPLLPQVNQLMTALNQPSVYKAVNDFFQEGAQIARDTAKEWEKLKELFTWFRGGTEGGVQPLTSKEELEGVDQSLARQRKKRDRYAPGSPDAKEAEAAIGALEERRRELLKKSVKEGVIEGMKEGVIQKQSFDGSGGGLGGLIHNAAFGGWKTALRGSVGSLFGYDDNGNPIAGDQRGRRGGGGIVRGAPADAPNGRIPETGRGVGSEAEVREYIRQAAKLRGIDPQVALGVGDREGLRGYNPGRMTRDRGGDQGTSFGPYQLHYKNNIPGMSNPGLGDAFTRRTGKHASDPRTWKDQVDFALDEAAKGGWRPWHGWRGHPRAGLSGARPMGIGAGRERATDESAARPPASGRNGGSDSLDGVPAGRGLSYPEGWRSRGGTGDSMMGRAFGPSGVGFAPRMEASGSVNVHLSGGLENLPAQVDNAGLFNEVSISRGRQMTRTDDN